MPESYKCDLPRVVSQASTLAALINRPRTATPGDLVISGTDLNQAIAEIGDADLGRSLAEILAVKPTRPGRFGFKK